MPPKATSEKSETNFTPREMTTLALAWQCLESDAKVDTKKLAKLAGYTEGSASVMWGQLRRKLKGLANATEKKNGDDQSAGDAGVTAAAPKATARKRKSKNSEDQPEESPKKVRGSNKKIPEIKPEATEDDDEMRFVNSYSEDLKTPKSE